MWSGIQTLYYGLKIQDILCEKILIFLVVKMLLCWYVYYSMWILYEIRYWFYDDLFFVFEGNQWLVDKISFDKWNITYTLHCVHKRKKRVSFCTNTSIFNSIIGYDSPEISFTTEFLKVNIFISNILAMWILPTAKFFLFTFSLTLFTFGDGWKSNFG